MCAQRLGKCLVLPFQEPSPSRRPRGGQGGGVGEGFSEEVTAEGSYGGQLSVQVRKVMGRRQGERM